MIRSLLVVFVILGSGTVRAGGEHSALPCQDSANTLEQDACVQREVDDADGRLRKLYVLVVKGFDSGATDTFSAFFFPEKKKALVTSQRAWVRYRDAQCAAVGASYGAGTGRASGIGFCLWELTKERMRFVRDFGGTVLLESILCREHKDECTSLR